MGSRLADQSGDRVGSRARQRVTAACWIAAAGLMPLGGCVTPDVPADVPEEEPPRIDSDMFKDVVKSLGVPCRAYPPLGVAEVEGQAFGQSPPTAQESVFRRPLTDGTLYIDPEIELATDCSEPASYLFRVAFDPAVAKLGEHPIDQDLVVVTVNIPGVGPVTPTRGTLAFKGYNPENKSVCGSIEAFFDDGEDGHIAASFKSRLWCP